MSLIISDRIVVLNLLIRDKPDAKDRIMDSIKSMGPGCLFDDFKTPEQIEGGCLILDWIIKHLEYESNGMEPSND